MYWLCYVYTQIGKHMLPVLLIFVLKFKDFGRSRTVTYRVQVVLSWKWYKIHVEILLHTTNRKWYIPHQTVPFLITLSDLEGHHLEGHPHVSKEIFCGFAEVDKISSDIGRDGWASYWALNRGRIDITVEHSSSVFFLSALIATRKGIQAVKLCSNKIPIS